MLRRPSINILRSPVLTAFALGLAACSSAPSTSTVEEPAVVPATNVNPPATTTAYESDVAQATTAGSAAGTAAAAPAAVVIDVPARATADFDRAVALMRAGNTSEAELEFKQLAEAYPQLAAPYVNLGLLYRKAGRLEQAEEALTAATARNGSSAVAWNELGVTRRLRGRFPEAAQAYERAIAADDSFAPAHRNLGVLLDLYLGQPDRALTEFERYKELSGEEKPVSGWIAELRQRTGKKAPPPPQREQAQDAAPTGDSEPAPPSGEPAPVAPPNSGA